MPVLDDYLTIIEAADILGVHPETVKRLCQKKRLTAQKVHNAWLIHMDHLKKFAFEYKEQRARRRHHE
jgi:excisionase family DNA binding protein